MARTIAKQIAKQVEAATAPFQCACSIKAGRVRCSHVAAHDRSIQTSPSHPMTGWGAYDLISRGDQILPFVGMLATHPLMCWKTS